MKSSYQNIITDKTNYNFCIIIVICNLFKIRICLKIEYFSNFASNQDIS